MYQCKNVKGIDKNGKFVEHGLCFHKDIFYPYLSVWDVVAFLIIFVVGATAASGGIGGGGVFVPILSIFTQFEAGYTIPISKTTIFGSSLCTFCIHFLRHHPTLKERPLIDYEVALVMEPAVLLGTTLGVLLNLVCPEWLIVILMVLALCYTGWKTASKGFKAMKKETSSSTNPKLQANVEKIERKIDNEKGNFEYSKLEGEEDTNDQITRMEQASNLLQSESSSDDDEEKALESNPKTANSNPENAEIEQHAEELQKLANSDNVAAILLEKPKNEDFEGIELKRLLADERSFFPYFKFFGLACNWVLIFVLSLIRGGVHGTPSVIGIAVCSAAYWFYYVLPIPLVLGFVCIAGAYLLVKNNRKEKLGHKFREGELKWNLRTLIIATNVCLLAGISSSFLGIGAGSLIAPILLEMGMNGGVSSATTSFMVLLSSSITSLQYLILGKIPWDYGILYFVCGLLGGVFGEIIIGYPAHRFGLTFLIIWSITAVVILSIFLMGGVGVWNIVKDFRQQAYMGFKSPCP